MNSKKLIVCLSILNMAEISHHTSPERHTGLVTSEKMQSRLASRPHRVFTDLVTFFKKFRANLIGRLGKLLLLSIDLGLLFLSPFAVLLLRDSMYFSLQKFSGLLPYSLINMLVGVICLLIGGTYRSVWRHVSLRDFTRIIAVAVLIVLISSSLGFVLYRLEGIPRSLPLAQLVFLIASMSSVRLAVRWWYGANHAQAVSRTVAQKDNVLVVGLNHVAELYLRCVADLAADRISIAGILDENPRLKGRLLHHHQVLGEPAELPQILAKFNVHGVEIKHVVITERFDALSEESRETLLRWERSGHVKLDMFEERLGFGKLQDGNEATGTPQGGTQDGQRLSARVNGKGSRRGVYAYVKRGLDIIGSLMLLLVLSPFILLVSLLVAFDVGFPLIFWQQRPGYKGIPFRLYKFRTMNSGHDKFGNRIDDEHRMSAIGRFMRRFRLDEFPQLFNILTGEMSFVGPRPLLPEDQPKGFNPRFAILPGLSGWAQVCGGKLVSVDDKAALDAWYVNHVSLWLDVKIIFRTIKMLIGGERLDTDAIRVAYAELDSGKHDDKVPIPLVSKDKSNNENYPVRKKIV